MRSERIAFGTDATHFFKKEEIKRGIHVLIYASRKSAGAAHLFVQGCATFEATFEKWSRAKRGKHPVPDERAPSTMTDTPFEGFWVVSAFRKLPKVQWVAFFRAQGYGFQSALEYRFPTWANDCSHLIKLPEGMFHDRSASHLAPSTIKKSASFGGCASSITCRLRIFGVSTNTETHRLC
jgi:hypothetical protein